MDQGKACLRAANTQETTQVYLVGSIHYKLATNPRYTFAYLMEYVRRIDPDVIAIEICKEHMGNSVEELNELYPPEFAAMIQAFGATKSVLAFNWMLPEHMQHRESFLKHNIKLRREFMSQPDRQGEKQFLGMVKEAIETVGNQGSAADVNCLAWDQLVHIRKLFDRCILRGSKYEEQLLYSSGDLNETRIATIDNNVKEIIDANRGKKILILTGAMHREHLVPFLRQQLKGVTLITEIQGE